MAKGAFAELRLQKTDIFVRKKISEIIQLETAEILSNSLLLGYYTGIHDSVNPQIEKAFIAIGDKCGYLF